MANLVTACKEQINELIEAAYKNCADEGDLPAGVEITGNVEIPKDVKFGDYASNFAMAAAKLFPPGAAQESSTFIPGSSAAARTAHFAAGS